MTRPNCFGIEELHAYAVRAVVSAVDGADATSLGCGAEIVSGSAAAAAAVGDDDGTERQLGSGPSSLCAGVAAAEP